MTAADAMASRPSRVEFIKALLAGIGENGERNDGRMPNDFKSIDSMLVSLGSCVFDLGAEDLVDGPYVKRLSQRERDGSSSLRLAFR
ncbi:MULTISPECIES: hypothetical protein [unclassified Luteibacter]|uniref:hypothetical protein n=1 Tax=Luteibacter sp. PvP019 TaxID=3156436 RepID=UPI003391B6FF